MMTMLLFEFPSCQIVEKRILIEWCVYACAHIWDNESIIISTTFFLYFKQLFLSIDVPFFKKTEMELLGNSVSNLPETISTHHSDKRFLTRQIPNAEY